MQVEPVEFPVPLSTAEKLESLYSKTISREVRQLSDSIAEKLRIEQPFIKKRKNLTKDHFDSLTNQMDEHFIQIFKNIESVRKLINNAFDTGEYNLIANNASKYMTETFHLSSIKFLYKSLSDTQSDVKKLKIIVNWHLTLSTLIFFKLLVEGGAQVIFTVSNELSNDKEILKAFTDGILRGNNDIFYMPWAEVQNHKNGQFDIAFDCGAGLYRAGVIPSKAMCELTHVEEKYENCCFPVISADISSVKEKIETRLGTGEGIIRALRQIVETELPPEASQLERSIAFAKKTRKVIIFGGGKVGRSILEYAIRNGVNPKNITVVDVSQEQLNTLADFGCDLFHLSKQPQDSELTKIKKIIKESTCVITATGVEGCISKYFNREDFFPGADNYTKLNKIKSELKIIENRINSLAYQGQKSSNPQFYAEDITELYMQQREKKDALKDLKQQLKRSDNWLRLGNVFNEKILLNAGTPDEYGEKFANLDINGGYGKQPVNFILPEPTKVEIFEAIICLCLYIGVDIANNSIKLPHQFKPVEESICEEIMQNWLALYPHYKKKLDESENFVLFNASIKNFDLYMADNEKTLLLTPACRLALQDSYKNNNNSEDTVVLPPELIAECMSKIDPVRAKAYYSMLTLVTSNTVSVTIEQSSMSTASVDMKHIPNLLKISPPKELPRSFKIKTHPEQGKTISRSSPTLSFMWNNSNNNIKINNDITVKDSETMDALALEVYKDPETILSEDGLSQLRQDHSLTRRS